MAAVLAPLPARDTVPAWRTVSRWVRWGGVATVLACVALIAWVDLPLAAWLHARGVDAHAWMRVPLGIPLSLSPLAGLYMLAYAGVRVPPHRAAAARRMFVACGGVLVALALKSMLKVAFGRTWPRLVVDPSPGAEGAPRCIADSCGYVNDGIHAFHPFAGSLKAYSAFPSGSTALLLAMIVPAMALYPRTRLPLALAGIASMACYVASNTHFLSDVVGGAFVGVACGLGAVAIIREGEAAGARR